MALNRQGAIGRGVVVVLTALDLEYTAVRAHLIAPERGVLEGGTGVEVGQLAGSTLRVALILSGEGAVAAAVIAERAITAFRPKALLYVGVAGGLARELRFGDVVVATRLYAIHGGKEEMGRFLARPRAWEAPHELLELARHLARIRAWSQVAVDDSERRGFEVYFKPIAVGDVVLNSRDTPLAQQLYEHYNDVAAIEMESVGAAHAAHLRDSLPVLTVRGISDKADGAKHRADTARRQPTAAANAALVAITLLKHWATSADPVDIHEAHRARSLGARQAVHGPRQLPADTSLFTGRVSELARLQALAEPITRHCGPGTVVTVAIDGMGGVGKTALAIHAGHRLAEAYPDGQLFLDLHGFAQDRTPLDPGDALAVLLRGLGILPRQIPAELDARAALYRDRLSGTRTLVVLDNAFDETQVRPLLPGTSGCLVLITSRRRLKALDDALPLTLDVLPPEEAVTLLRQAARLPTELADDDLCSEAAALCGRLPLALLIAGALLRGGRAWNLQRLIDRFTAPYPGQELAGYTDETRSLAAIFDLSNQHLPENERRLFRRLGLLPGPEIDAYAAAALLDIEVAQADLLLQHLSDHSLLAGVSPSRYRIHDLIRAYARTLTFTTDSDEERQAAVDRLLSYYQHIAQRADVLIARFPRPEPNGIAPRHAPALPDPETARAWLRAERANLDAAFDYSHSHGLAQHAVALAAGLAEIMHTDGPLARALNVHETSVAAAGRLGDQDSQANALINLGRARLVIGNYPGAAEAFGDALGLYLDLGQSHGQANAFVDLGRVRYLTGDYGRATDALTEALGIYHDLGHYLARAGAVAELGSVRQLAGDYSGAADAFAESLRLYRDLGHLHGQANALAYLGIVRYLTGDYTESVDMLRKALGIYRDLGHHLGEAIALAEIGRVRMLTEDYHGAISALTDALELYRRLGHRHGQALTLAEIGRVQMLTKDYGGAADSVTEALETYRDLGNRGGEAWVLNYHAALRAAVGEHLDALELYRQTLVVHRELNKHGDEGISLEGIGDCLIALGAVGEGAMHLNQALKIYQRLGTHADTARVTARLANLPLSETPGLRHPSTDMTNHV